MAGATQHDLSGREAEVIRKVAETLQELVSLSEGRSGCKTCFDSASVPPISVKDYVERLWKYMDCSIQCFVFGITYIQRIIDKHPDIRVSTLNVHTMTFSSLVVAAKFHDDTFRTNPYYAQVGGVSTSGLYNLECSLLKLLNWQAGVTMEEFGCCCDLLFHEDRLESLRLKRQAPPDSGSFFCGRKPTNMQACPATAVAAESLPTCPLAASKESNQEGHTYEDEKLTQAEGKDSPMRSPMLETKVVQPTASVSLESTPKLAKQSPACLATDCPVAFLGRSGASSGGGRRGGGSARPLSRSRSRGSWISTAMAALPWLSTSSCGAEAALGFVPGRGQLSASLLAGALSLFAEVQPCSHKLWI